MQIFTRKRFSVAETIGIAATAVLAVAVVTYAVTVPHTFQNGTVADATQVNDNFNALVTAVTTLEGQVASLTATLQGVTRNGNDLTFSGVNVHVVNGQGSTQTINGLGNLIVGYNELRGSGDDRSGSHNIIVGIENNYPSYGGLVAGYYNTISGPLASVSGGYSNNAVTQGSTVTGGTNNTATGFYSSVTGGSYNVASGVASFVGGGGGNTSALGNTAFGHYSAILGGLANVAGDPLKVDHTLGLQSSVSGGEGNTASGSAASVSGGGYNVASGSHSFVGGGGWSNSYSNNKAFSDYSAILGGQNNIAGDPNLSDHAIGQASTVSGGNYNTASGLFASVSGGSSNSASGFWSSVSGGDQNTASHGNDSVSGGGLNIASGGYSSVSGGEGNTASGDFSSVSGGYNHTASVGNGWAGGNYHTP